MLEDKFVGYLAGGLLALSSLLVASGCGADRFEDEGCTSDDQCYGERICEDNQCIDPAEQTPAEDAGDAGPGSDVPIPDAGSDSGESPTDQYVGTWQLQATIEVTLPDGDTESGEDEVTIDIIEGTNSDLEVQLETQENTCDMPADLAGDGFELDENGCSVEENDVEMNFRDVDGGGHLEGGQLHFSFDAVVEQQLQDRPVELDYSVDGQGTRAN